jgi:probable HAF family extracellular repeat protein
VLLDEVAANCTVEGPNPRIVNVSASSTRPVIFNVTCSATTGSIEVLLTMTGEYLDTDGGLVSVDGGEARQLELESAVTFTDLAPGPHTILLNDVAANCSIEGQNPRDVEVVAGQTVPTTYAIECGPCGAGHGPYQAIDLGSLQGGVSRARSINNRGQVVGTSGAIYSDEWPRAFVWQNGVMTDIGHPDSVNYLSYGADINNHGQVVGGDYEWAGANSCCNQAFLWEDGVRLWLGSLGGGRSEAYGINDNGQVVGWSHTGQEWHAFSWRDGLMVDLGTLGGDYSRAFAVNSRGQIVGGSKTPSGAVHLVLWEAGMMTDLGVALGAAFINDAGQIAGYGRVGGSDQYSSFIWEDGVFTDLGSFIATGINNCGQVLGFRPGIDGAEHQTVLWEDGVVTDVGTIGTTDINDAGQIVGAMEVESSDGYATDHATLWTRSYDTP